MKNNSRRSNASANPFSKARKRWQGALRIDGTPGKPIDLSGPVDDTGLDWLDSEDPVIPSHDNPIIDTPDPAKPKKSKFALKFSSKNGKNSKSQPKSRKPKFSGLNGNLKSTTNLPECKTIDEVDKLFGNWWSTFRQKSLRPLEKNKLVQHSTLKELTLMPGATSAPHIGNELICFDSCRAVREGLTGVSDNDSTIDEFAFVTIIDGADTTSHFNTEIDLIGSQRRAHPTLRAMASNYFAVTEHALFNSHGHKGGGQMLQSHHHAVVFGPRGTIAKANSIALRHAARFTPNFTGATPIDVKPMPADAVNIARIAAYLFKPPHKCKNWKPPIGDKPGHMNHSEAGDRLVRYLRLAQLRTMMTIEDITFASGIGLRIRSDMIKFVRALAKRESANGKEVLHPDAISSFWVDIMSSANLYRWNLPIIKRRP